MRASSIPLLTAAIALAALAGVAPAPGQKTPSLAGEWRLVEQYYGTGQRNFVEPSEPYRLSLRLDGGRIAGTATLSERSAAWPAYFGPDGPRPLQDVTVTPDADGLGVRATFRVTPPPGDDTWLFVTETLRAGPDGKLAATMTVEFERMGERRGAFTWRRVFVREDGP
jgi:hypothetical protein